jgi:pimeloyl-ACP methyl ester carboxylesterase
LRRAGACLALISVAFSPVSACTSKQSGTPAPPTASPSPSPTTHLAGFTDCSKRLAPSTPITPHNAFTAVCGSVSVPLDYGKPSGKSIGIAVIRIHNTASGPHPPSLVVNPGGPGASGVGLALQLIDALPPRILRTYDLVGFDPRGVGASSPIRCVSDARMDEIVSAGPDMTTAAGRRAAQRVAAEFARACQRRYGATLPLYNTVNTARDLDRVRIALRDKKLDYLGFSYGTELGSVYAHLFPDKVGAMVLDGAVDPKLSGAASLAQQTEGFEKSFDQFAKWCDTDRACEVLRDPRAVAEDIVRRARRTPLPTGTPRTLTFALADTGILLALYSRQLWEQLGRALVQARRGDGSGLLQLADRYFARSPRGHYSGMMDAYATIWCNDSPAGPSDAAIARIARRWNADYPLFGGLSGVMFTSSLFMCQQWQPRRTVPPMPSAATPSRVLVLGNLHDPATPYRGAVDLARAMGKAEVLTWNGEGHTSFLEGSRCVDGYVTRYLVTDTLPPDSTTCPA